MTHYSREPDRKMPKLETDWRKRRERESKNQSKNNQEKGGNEFFSASCQETQ
jgi:hypothetical protein